MEKIWLSSPHMGETEHRYVADAFATNWIAPIGPNITAFEQALSSFLSVSNVVALSSGTAAIHLALRVLGVQRGDLVLCQNFTFAASAFPILYCGATPIFIDSEFDTWNMDPELLHAAIVEAIENGKKPAAIIVVHLYGMPAKMERIVQIASQYGIPVVEDAAEALGSTYQSKACGTLGDIGIVSFNGNKIITTSGGGALLTNNAAYAKKARFLSSQAKEPAPYYLHYELGYNYAMSNVAAGIGRGQMEVLPQRVARRQAIFNFYQQQLKAYSFIHFLAAPSDSVSNCWLTTITIDPSYNDGHQLIEKIRTQLEAKNIETRRLWNPMHLQPLFSDCLVYTNGVSDALFLNGLCLPSGSNLTQTDLTSVVFEIKKCLNEFDEKKSIKAVSHRADR